MPTVFFGFSFGAILAYEAAMLLTERCTSPLGLVVASAEHPGWEGRREGVAPNGGATKELSEEAFTSVLKDKGGTNAILNDPGMKSMFLPVIKADMAMEEAYGTSPPTHGRKLACPIVVFRGADCPLISRDATEPWLELSSCSGEGMPTRLEELSAGLQPSPQNPWLCDWYLCQGVLSTDAMVAAIARDFGGVPAAESPAVS